MSDLYGLGQSWVVRETSYQGNTGVHTESGLYICSVPHEVAHRIVSDHNELAASEARADALATANQRLREGLAWYANEANYEDSLQTVSPEMPGLGPIHYYAPSIAEDRGERARALLARQPAGCDAIARSICGTCHGVGTIVQRREPTP
jgi:hypothetical protein